MALNLGVRGRNRKRRLIWLGIEFLMIAAFVALVIVIGARWLRQREVRLEEEAARQLAVQAGSASESGDGFGAFVNPAAAPDDGFAAFGIPAPENEAGENVVTEEVFGYFAMSEAVEPTAEPVAAEPVEAEPVSVEDPGDEPPIQAYFVPLLQQNSDTVGLISFEDKSLYVCQGYDNQYYANHRFDGTEDPAGMIYMDCRCGIFPQCDNIILYGHNMHDGSRFGTLKRFVHPEHLLTYPVFEFASLYETVQYVPISVFYTTAEETDAEYFEFAQCHFEDRAAFERYIEAVKQRSEVELPTTAKYGDRLLTLATCSEEMNRGRLIIVCREKR